MMELNGGPQDTQQIKEESLGFFSGIANTVSTGAYNSRDFLEFPYL